MIKHNFYLLFIIFIFFLSCKDSKIITIHNRNLEYKHSNFIINSPGKDWKVEEVRSKLLFHTYDFRVHFSHNDSSTHSKLASVSTWNSSISFSSSDGFIKYYIDSFSESYPPPRYNKLLINFPKDLACKGFCLLHQFKYKDFYAKNKGDLEYLILEGYEYIFMVSEKSKTIIYISYSERGKKEELINVKENAGNFICNLKVIKDNI